MTSGGDHGVNPISAAQHMFGMGQGVAASSTDPTSYLGPPTGALATDPYDRVRHTNYDYPEAVKDQTLFVKSTIEGFIMEDIEWYTTLALPWAQTDQISVTWNEWHFTKGLADRVPHEGVSRLITSSKREFKTHVVRRGLAFVQEADFANTPDGIEQYALNVRSIAQSVQETQNHDTLLALLTAKTYFKLWTQRFGTMQFDFNKVLENENAMFGSVCLPDGDGRLMVQIADHKRIMRKQGVTPDMWIGWPGSTIYMTKVDAPMRTEYWKAGPDGVQRKERGPDSLKTIQGMAVFEARDFDVYADEPPVQLLTRDIQIAEHYFMVFDRREENVAGFETKSRGLVLYDANLNQWVKIGFLRAFQNARLFDGNGKYTRDLRQLVARYRARGQRSADAEVEIAKNGEGDVHMSMNKHPSMFLTAPDNEGDFMLIRYFGQMELKHMKATDVERIGETIAAKMGEVSGEAWQQLVRLVHDIESQPYVHEYWLALIAANTRANLSAEGEFVGETTPQDIVDYWSLPGAQRQFVHNSYGSLNLPQDASMAAIGFPSGFANGPGLQTLAAEANKTTSPWRDVGRRAENAVMLIEHMLEVLRMRLPSSAAVDAKGRAPWFHRPDAIATFYDSVVGVRRDPLFMLALPAAGASGLASTADLRGAGGGGGGGGSRDEGLSWFALPGTVHDIPAGSVATGTLDDVALAVKTGTVAGARNIRMVQSAATTGTNVTFFSPTLGGNVNVPASQFASAIRFTPELQGFGMMPAGDSVAAVNARRAYYNVIGAVDDAATRRKFMSFVSAMGILDRERMWSAVSGFRAIDSADIPTRINAIYLDATATEAQVAVAQATVTELADLGTEDSAAFARAVPLVDTWQPIITKLQGGGQQSLFAFQEVADDAQRILEIERDIAALTGTDVNALRGNVFDPAVIRPGGVLGTGLPTVGTPQRAQYEALTAELTPLLNRVNTVFARQVGTGAGAVPDARLEAERRAQAAVASGDGPVFVSDDPAAIAQAQYYRTPLTSSLHLLQSLSDRFGGQTAKPLIAPSDPATRHTQPFSAYGAEGEAHLPGDVLGRRQFRSIRSIQLGAAIEHAIDAPNYRTLYEITAPRSAMRSLDTTPLIERHAGAKDGAAGRFAAAAESADGRSQRGAGAGFDSDGDDDEDYYSDDDADDIGRVFESGAPVPMRGVSASSAPSSLKRARIGADYNGGHDDSDHDEATGKSHKRVRTSVFAERWRAAGSIANPYVRIAALTFLLTRADKAESWEGMIENDILAPVNLIMWRPQIVFGMASGIMMKGGGETGANLHGGANASKSHDGISKLIYYNFTFRSKAVVWKEKNISIIENIKFESYNGGLNTEFVVDVEDLEREDRDRPSIVVTAVGIAEDKFNKNMDYSGRLNIPQASNTINREKGVLYSSYEFYDMVTLPLSRRVSEPDPEHEDFLDHVAADHVTLISAQGTAFGFNVASNRFNRFVEPQGKLKRNMCYPGAAAVLNGDAASFTEYNYEGVVIE